MAALPGTQQHAHDCRQNGEVSAAITAQNHLEFSQSPLPAERSQPPAALSPRDQKDEHRDSHCHAENKARH